MPGLLHSLPPCPDVLRLNLRDIATHPPPTRRWWGSEHTQPCGWVPGRTARRSPKAAGTRLPGAEQAGLTPRDAGFRRGLAVEERRL